VTDTKWAEFFKAIPWTMVFTGIGIGSVAIGTALAGAMRWLFKGRVDDVKERVEDIKEGNDDRAEDLKEQLKWLRGELERSRKAEDRWKEMYKDLHRFNQRTAVVQGVLESGSTDIIPSLYDATPEDTLQIIVDDADRRRHEEERQRQMLEARSFGMPSTPPLSGFGLLSPETARELTDYLATFPTKRPPK
jgi:hypothetical protein